MANEWTLSVLQKQKNKPDSSGATVISDNNRLTSIQTTGGNRRNENNANNEGLPIQQQEMNDIQVRSNVVNNAAMTAPPANNASGTSPNNERHCEATIEVAIASPEEDVEATVGTTAALVNNTNNTSADPKDNNVSEEVPQVKISNL